MNTRRLIKKLGLSEEAFDRIRAAVHKAESKTMGEIAVAITAESAHYSFWELLFSNVAAGIILLVLLPLSAQIESLYQRLYWNNAPTWILPFFYIVTYFAAVAITFYVSNIPAVDRLIIPRNAKRTSVTHRAMRHFAESGIYETENHSGILIFVSYMERQVRIIADTGISRKISQDLWNIIAEELSEELKNGKTSEAFCGAVKKCGELLAEQFPADKDNPNEIADGLVILEDSEWY